MLWENYSKCWLSLPPSLHPSVCLSVSSRSVPPAAVETRSHHGRAHPTAAYQQEWESGKQRITRVTLCRLPPKHPPPPPQAQPWAPKWRLLFGLCQPYKSEAGNLLSWDIISCDAIIGFSFYGPDESDILLIKWPRCLLMLAKRAHDAHYASFSEALIVLKRKSRFNTESSRV